MADDQEKTEQATPKRLAEAREQGNVPKSAELNSVFIILSGLLTLHFIGSTILGELQSGFRSFYEDINQYDLNSANVYALLSLGLKGVVNLLAPLLLVVAVVGLAVNISQIGFLFTLKTMEPNFSKINPISGFKKFFALKSFVELAKGILKILIVGSIAYWTLMEQKDRYLFLVYGSVGEIMRFIGTVMFQIILRTGIALLLLAILDLIYQKWQYKKDMMMTKEQVKEEAKQAEGDPLVKGAIKSLQQARSRERMMSNVPDADVVVTNPIHLAVALKYDPEETSAPIVVAKGARLLAEKIKEVARGHNIPIIENKSLARSLYKLGEIGKEIPFELFHTVAEVFAYVYQMKNRMN